MNKPDFIIDISSRSNSGALTSYDIQRSKELLKLNGIVLLPSDTCYSLAALAISRDIYKSINSILNRNEEPISVAFPNFKTVEEYVKLHMFSATLLEKFTPGPITVVCQANSKIPSAFTEEVVRSTDGTVGVRIPDSYIEREIANCTKYPITTVAIRDKNKKIVQDFKTAIEIVKDGMSKLSNPISWAAIEGGKFFSQHSTVVRINEKTKQVELIREGEIPFEKIRIATSHYPIWNIENWK